MAERFKTPFLQRLCDHDYMRLNSHRRCTHCCILG